MSAPGYHTGRVVIGRAYSVPPPRPHYLNEVELRTQRALIRPGKPVIGPRRGADYLLRGLAVLFATAALAAWRWV